MNNKSFRWPVLAGLVLATALSSWPGAAIGEEATKPSVAFDWDSKSLAGSLPRGPFTIEGEVPRSVKRMRVSFARGGLAVHPTRRDTAFADDAAVHHRLAVVTVPDGEGPARVVVSMPRLVPGKDYAFRITIWIGGESDSEAIGKLRQDITGVLHNLLVQADTTGNFQDKALAEGINGVLQPGSQPLFYDANWLPVRVSEDSVSPLRRAATKPRHTRRFLREGIAGTIGIVNKLRKELRDLDLQTCDEARAAALSDLQAPLLAHSVGGWSVADYGDQGALEAFIEEGEKIRDMIEASASTEALGCLPDSARTRITGLSDFAMNSINDRLKEARDLPDKIESQIAAVNNLAGALLDDVLRRIDAFAQSDFEMLDFDSRFHQMVAMDVGISVIPRLDELAPYIGLSFSFAEVDKDIPLDRYGGFFGGWRQRLSLVVGTNLNQISANDQNLGVVLGTQQLMVGGGYRVQDFVRLGCGVMIHKRPDANPVVPDKKITASPYISGSVDVDAVSLIKGLYSAISKTSDKEAGGS